jgi:hypothetical protein
VAAKKLNIEGVAIDSSVNSNKWQIPDEDLDYVTKGLENAQLRIDHGDSVLSVVGKVNSSKRDGKQVLFGAEVGDALLIEKILNNYVNHVSIQVDSDNVECSKCGKPTRADGMLAHLCPGAWEVIHKPSVRELSVVASPAYKDTAFKPVGFGAAMDETQKAFFDSQMKLAVAKEKFVLQAKVAGLKAKLDEEPREKTSASEDALRKKLAGLLVKQKELSDKSSGLWKEKDKESQAIWDDYQKKMKPINDKYNRMQAELSAELQQVQSEIAITQQAIAGSISE